MLKTNATYLLRKLKSNRKKQDMAKEQHTCNDENRHESDKNQPVLVHFRWQYYFPYRRDRVRNDIKNSLHILFFSIKTLYPPKYETDRIVKSNSNKVAFFLTLSYTPLCEISGSIGIQKNIGPSDGTYFSPKKRFPPRQYNR